MAHVRTANRHGTAADGANHAPGYVASGEGQHSRRVARGNMPTKFAGRLPVRTQGHKLTLDRQIAEYERRLEWAECELKLEPSPTRKAKLAKDIEIRGKFLTRLLDEREQLK